MTSLSSGLKTVSQSANLRRGAYKLVWKKNAPEDVARGGEAGILL